MIEHRADLPELPTTQEVIDALKRQFLDELQQVFDHNDTAMAGHFDLIAGP